MIRKWFVSGNSGSRRAAENRLRRKSVLRGFEIFTLEDRRVLSVVLSKELFVPIDGLPDAQYQRLSNELLDLFREVTTAPMARGAGADLSGYFVDDVAPLIYQGDSVGITVTTSDAMNLLPSLEHLGFQVTASIPERNIIEGFLPVEALDDVTLLGPQGLMGVIGIARPGSATGSVNSQADYTLQASSVRATGPLNLTGAGVKVGVISDSFNRLGGAAADIASGDLPNDVLNFLEGPATGIIDEGRAMAQLVYDLAP